MTLSKGMVNRAGKALVEPGIASHDLVTAENVINQWRALHVAPLNSVMMTLKNHAKKVDPTHITGQRLKRLPSIRLKLEQTPNMQLARMVDIAGGRAIMKDVLRVYQLAAQLIAARSKNVSLLKDYIKEPKASGYRGIHLRSEYSSKVNPECNGLLVELQIRTKLQHIWATGVETVGAIINSPLKSNVGPEEWKTFFKIVSAGLAAHESGEDSPPSRRAPGEVGAMLRQIDAKLNAVSQLMAFGHAIKVVDEQNKDRRHKAFLLHFKPAEGKVETRGYLGEDMALAMIDYQKWEKASAPDLGENVVLVDVGSIDNLRKAYPNYFADTAQLCTIVKKMKNS